MSAFALSDLITSLSLLKSSMPGGASPGAVDPGVDHI
jgi:hypothetical protein